MAPEQLRGERTGPASDLYSLGVVLYESSSGERPFQGSTGEDLIDKVLNEDARDLHVAGDLQGRFASIVRRLLERELEARYREAAELQKDIASLQRDLDLAEYIDKEAPGKMSIAVLPFRLLTPGAEDAYLSVALADAVINHLSTSPHLFVRPTSSIVKYTHGDVAAAGRELNVDFVVDGSVQKYGAQLRVHVQARHTLDGRSLASLRFDSSASDLFGLQDRVGQGLLHSLAPQSEDTHDTRPPTENALAFELYLRAGEALSRMNRWDMDHAFELLSRATTLDPRFADAWARLAEVCIEIGVLYEGTPEWFARADNAVHTALRLDSSNADAHCAEGQLLWTPQRNYAHTAALRALNRALELNPGCHAAQIWRGLILFHLGLHVEARQGLTAALARSPFDVRTLVFLGQAALYAGDYERADEYDARALAAEPTNVWANLHFPGIALYLGKPDLAMERIRLTRQLLPAEPTIDSMEALVWAHRGEIAKAYSILESGLSKGKPLLHTHHIWHHAAGVYAMGGDADRAIGWLKSASDMGFPNYPLFVRDPHLRSLAGNPPFQQLMDDVKTQWLDYRRQFGDPSVAESAQ
jgi:TolB-like protein/Flp pilus assembly protein TadD